MCRHIRASGQQYVGAFGYLHNVVSAYRVRNTPWSMLNVNRRTKKLPDALIPIRMMTDRKIWWRQQIIKKRTEQIVTVR